MYPQQYFTKSKLLINAFSLINSSTHIGNYGVATHGYSANTHSEEDEMVVVARVEGMLAVYFPEAPFWLCVVPLDAFPCSWNV